MIMPPKNQSSFRRNVLFRIIGNRAFQGIFCDQRKTCNAQETVYHDKSDKGNGHL